MSVLSATRTRRIASVTARLATFTPPRSPGSGSRDSLPIRRGAGRAASFAKPVRRETTAEAARGSSEEVRGQPRRMPPRNERAFDQQRFVVQVRTQVLHVARPLNSQPPPPQVTVRQPPQVAVMPPATCPSEGSTRLRRVSRWRRILATFVFMGHPLAESVETSRDCERVHAGSTGDRGASTLRKSKSEAERRHPPRSWQALPCRQRQDRS